MEDLLTNDNDYIGQIPYQHQLATIHNLLVLYYKDYYGFSCNADEHKLYLTREEI